MIGAEDLLDAHDASIGVSIFGADVQYDHG